MTEDKQNHDKVCFIDSNIWLYAFIETPHKTGVAQSLIKNRDITVSTQVINEVCVNLIKKAHFPERKIRNLTESFYNKYNVIEINRDVLLKACDIREKHNFSFWDSLIVASALIWNSKILYSEDMQADFVIEETRIVNPFRMS
ncbi:MAG: PIN domain-containing protein [Desulfamplus sp.]|nr:PIN domain-containing protein [Desulfamplus sp.]